MARTMKERPTKAPVGSQAAIKERSERRRVRVALLKGVEVQSMTPKDRREWSR